MEEREAREYLDAHYQDLVGALTLICGDRGLAEEAVQEALVKAWRLSQAGLKIEMLAAWVRTAAFNNAKSRFRRLGRERAAFARLAHQLRTEASSQDLGAAEDMVDLTRSSPA